MTHNQHLAAFLAFVVFVVYLMFVDVRDSKARHVVAGITCGLAMAFMLGSGPTGLMLSVALCAALGRYGIEWAA